MKKANSIKFSIRQACPEDYELLGKLSVKAYEALPGMPDSREQPDYYSMLLDVKSRAERPSVEILVAISQTGVILGGVTFIGDMKYYDSGGTACGVLNGSGIRLLAVDHSARHAGIGRALTIACMERAKALGSDKVILHTTKAMNIAWQLYENMGYQRLPELDFMQGELEVFGFCYDLKCF